MNLPTLLFLFGITIIFLGLVAAGILWAIKSGQYDDMEGPAQRILMDDNDPMIPFRHLNHEANKNSIKK